MAAGENAACMGILVCAMICGVMAAGCSSLSANGDASSPEDGLMITIDDGNIGANFASYPVTVKNNGIFSVKDVRLKADLMDVTGGGETVLSTQEIDAGSFAPGESRTVDVVFRLIKLTGKDVDLRVTRIG